MRPCPKCGEREVSSRHATYCKPCGAEYAKAQRAKRKQAVGTTMHPGELRKRFDCSVEEYTERMATSSSCQSCGSTHRIQYDHCHDSMEFRGVLCWDCNVGIGKLGDSVEGLRNALAYLESHYDT
jgi:ribosomal protein L32